MRPDGDLPATTVVPLLRYRDVAAAIEWLCKAFGFEEHFVVRGDGGSVLYAQLTSGSGMVMLGPVSDSDFDKLFKQPDEVGGAETQSCYIAIDQIQAHFERAKSAGAEVVFDLQQGSHGALGYSCKDLEGHIWNFGTYHPWRDKRQPGGPPAISETAEKPRGRGLLREVVVLGLCVTALAVSVSVLNHRGILDLPIKRWADLPPFSGVRSQESAGAGPDTHKDMVSRVLEQEGELTELEKSVAKARLELADAIAQKERIELALEDINRRTKETDQAAEGTRRLVASVEQQRDAAQSAADAARRELEGTRADRDREAGLRQMADQELEKERAAKAIAEQTAEELKLKLADEVKARETAERAVVAAQSAEEDARKRLALAEEALAKATAAQEVSRAAPATPHQEDPVAGAPPVSNRFVAQGESNTRVQAWTAEDKEQPAVSEPLPKTKAVVKAKRRVKTVKVAKKSSPPPAEPALPTYAFPTPRN